MNCFEILCIYVWILQRMFIIFKFHVCWLVIQLHLWRRSSKKTWRHRIILKWRRHRLRYRSAVVSNSIVSGCFTRRAISLSCLRSPCYGWRTEIKGKWIQPHPASLHIPRRSPSLREITVISSSFFFSEGDLCFRWKNLKNLVGLS